MKKRIKNFKDFKLIKEEDEFNFDSDFNFEDDQETSEEETPVEDQETEEEETEEVQKEVEPNKYNQNPSYYLTQALKKVELRLIELFNKDKTEEQEDTNNPKDRVEEKDPSSFIQQGVDLIDMKITKMPMGQTLLLKYGDSNFTYHLSISVPVDEGSPEYPDMEMDTNLVDEGGIKFKKYDMQSNLLGELDKKKINLSEINQDLLDQLNADFDKKYDVDSGFEIEYDEDNKSEEENQE